jgi:hypothetical protein
MKSSLMVLAVAAFCTFNPVQADEQTKARIQQAEEITKARIQARLRAIDTDVLLKQYETIQTELAKIQMQLALTDADATKSDNDRKKELGMLRSREDTLVRLRLSCVTKLEALTEVEVASSEHSNRAKISK